MKPSSLQKITNKTKDLLLKGLLVIFLLGGVCMAQDPVAQPLDIQLNKGSVSGRIEGKILIPVAEKSLYTLDFYLLAPKTGALIWWRGSTPIFLIDDNSGKRTGVFAFDISDEVLHGNYILYGAIVDDFSKKIGIGKTKIKIETVSEEEAVEQGKIFDPQLKWLNEAEVKTSIKFKNGGESHVLHLEASVYEYDLTDFKEKYIGKRTAFGALDEKNIEVKFPKPPKPGSYLVVLRVIDGAGKAYGSEHIVKMNITGLHGKVLGITPTGSKIDPKDEVLQFALKGFVSIPGEYRLIIRSLQNRIDGNVNYIEKTQELTIGPSLQFEYEDVLLVEDDTKQVELLIRMETESGLEFIQENKIWTRIDAPDVPEIEPTQDLVQQKRDPSVFQFFLKSNSAFIIFVLVLGVTFCLSFVGMIFLIKKKNLLLILFVGAGISLLPNQAHAQITQYQEPFIKTPIAIDSFSTDSTKDEGFRNIMVEGIIENAAGATAFFDYDLDTIDIEIINTLGGTAVATLSSKSEKDIQFYQEPITPYALFGWAYRLYFDITGIPLSDGEYGINFTFNFAGGDTLEQEIFPYFRIDTNNPSVLFNVLDSSLVNNKKTISIICTDSSEHCLDQPTIGTGLLEESPEKQFDADVLGNFCDGVNDAGKICKTDLGDGSELYSTYEVCDSVGNCIDSTPTGDLTYYDPFPPSFSVVELLRPLSSEGVQKTESRNSTQLTGGTMGASTTFTLELTDDVDNLAFPTDTISIGGQNFLLDSNWEQGPAGDPNACGEQEYDSTIGTPETPVFKDRLYSGKKSDFYFGASLSDPTVSKCRQRIITCSNSIGHRGYIDRSITPTTATTPEDCSLDGVPELDCSSSSIDCCGPGYEYDSPTEACRKFFDCNPLKEDLILLENGGLDRVWMVEGSPVETSQEWTEEGVTPGTTDCSWGCKYGTDSNGKCNPVGCFYDKFPYCFPLCLDGLSFNNNRTPGDPSDDYCE